MFLKFIPFNVCVLVAAMGGTMPAAAQLSPEWRTCTGNADADWAAEVISRRVRLAHFPLPCARCGTLVSLGRGAISLPPAAKKNGASNAAGGGA